MKTYGLLRAGNVRLHFIAVSPAAVPSPISYTTSLISLAGWEGFFRERALAQPTERCGCKGYFIAAISTLVEPKDAPSSSMHPRPPWRLNSCIAGDLWSGQGEAGLCLRERAAGTRLQPRALPANVHVARHAPHLLAAFTFDAYAVYALIKHV